MSEKKNYTEQEIFDICNASLTAAINCAERGQRSCKSCKLLVECKKSNEEIDKLWNEKP